MKHGRIRIGGAPLRGPLRVLTVALCLVALALVARVWQAPRDYEAHAVVQVRSEGEALRQLQARLLTRAMLTATGARHGLQDTSALTLATAITLNPLIARAGETLGLPPQEIGVIVSVRLPDPELAMRIANDVALQILDLGQSGKLEAGYSRLVHFRSEEDRLWQEISALQSDPGLDGAGLRHLTLMRAELTEVRQRLAKAQVDAGLAERIQAQPYGLLARATVAEHIVPPQILALWPLAAGALLLALISTLLGREISLPFRPEPL